MTFKEFRVNILKANTKKQHLKIYNSYGVKDIYRWCIKNKLIGKDISEKNFRIIINTLNTHLQDQLLQNKKVIFPCRMGGLRILKNKRRVYYKDGKLKIAHPVNWKKTLDLWYKDEEAKQNKILIRDEHSINYQISYIKKRTNYKNAMYFAFTPIRDIKIKLKELINNGGFDALMR